MTARERMTAVYRGQLPDRAPAGIYTRYLARGETEHRARSMGLGVIDYAPPVSMLAPPWHVLDGFLSRIDGGDFSVRYTWENGRRLEERRVGMPEGDLYAVVEQDGGGVGSEHIRKHYVETKEDYALAQAAARRTVFGDNRGLFRARVQAMGNSGVVLGRLDRSPLQKCLLELCAQDAFLLDVMDGEDAALSLLETLRIRLLEAAERVIASEAEIIWLPDNVTAEMTSPALFRTYCLPYYRTLAGWAREAGKPLLVHCDGKVRALMPMLRESGITAVESLSYPEMAGDVAAAEAGTLFPGAPVLPNFPANRAYQTREEIIGWVDEQKRLMKGTPWMLQISEDLPADESDKVILAVSEAMREGA